MESQDCKMENQNREYEANDRVCSDSNALSNSSVAAKYAGMIFSTDPADLEQVEAYLKTLDDLSLIWNQIDMALARCIEDYSRWDLYPLTWQLLKKRVKAYRDVDNGRYSNPLLSTKRLLISTFGRSAYLTLLQYCETDIEGFNLLNQSDETNEEMLASNINAINIYQLFSLEDKTTIGLIGVEHYQTHWAIWYYVVPEQRRKGYAAEACQSIIENIRNHTIKDVVPTKYRDVYRRRSIGKKKIMANPLKENLPSCQLLEKLGFVKISERGDRVVYSLEG